VCRTQGHGPNRLPGRGWPDNPRDHRHVRISLSRTIMADARGRQSTAISSARCVASPCHFVFLPNTPRHEAARPGDSAHGFEEAHFLASGSALNQPSAFSVPSRQTSSTRNETPGTGLTDSRPSQRWADFKRLLAGQPPAWALCARSLLNAAVCLNTSKGIGSLGAEVPSDNPRRQ